MSITFEEIMNYHPGNRNVYDEIKTNIVQLLPFVGAGLTAPFYKGWTDALGELGKNIASEELRQELDELLKAGKLLEAAQYLQDKRGKTTSVWTW